MPRSRENRWIAGVYGGIAERLDWPAGLVRLLDVLLSLTPFPGLLVYLFFCVSVPDAESVPGPEPLRASEADDGFDDDFQLEASPRSRGAALAFAALLGGLGAHRFYTGRFTSGVLMLLTFGGFGIWWLIDLIRIAAGGRSSSSRPPGPRCSLVGEPPRRAQWPASRPWTSRPGASSFWTSRTISPPASGSCSC